MRLNQATMQKIVEHWMETRFLNTAHQEVLVTQVKSTVEGNAHAFDIDFHWQEPVPK